MRDIAAAAVRLEPGQGLALGVELGGLEPLAQRGDALALGGLGLERPPQPAQRRGHLGLPAGHRVGHGAGGQAVVEQPQPPQQLDHLEAGVVLQVQAGRFRPGAGVERQGEVP